MYNCHEKKNYTLKKIDFILFKINKNHTLKLFFFEF